ncbi:hypothetical protein ALP75_205296 [Pseudomonas syringae pv. actinidiae]|nr:hypothetical protein ALP75_205296 [Pseudomonas syringae pv. actinidiae]
MCPRPTWRRQGRSTAGNARRRSCTACAGARAVVVAMTRRPASVPGNRAPASRLRSAWYERLPWPAGNNDHLVQSGRTPKCKCGRSGNSPPAPARPGESPPVSGRGSSGRCVPLAAMTARRSRNRPPVCRVAPSHGPPALPDQSQRYALTVGSTARPAALCPWGRVAATTPGS